MRWNKFSVCHRESNLNLDDPNWMESHFLPFGKDFPENEIEERSWKSKDRNLMTKNSFQKYIIYINDNKEYEIIL